MILTSEYKVDIWQLKREKDDGKSLEEYLLRKRASEFGTQFCKHIPFEKIEDVDNGYNPKTAPIYSNEPIPCHTYKLQVFAVKLDSWKVFKNCLHTCLINNGITKESILWHDIKRLIINLETV